MRDWLLGWYITLRIRFFERDTWDYLTRPLDDADFTEVDEP